MFHLTKGGAPFYTVRPMGDTFTSLLYRLQGELPRILVELLLIALCVNWCASVLQSTRGTRPLRGVLVVLIVATIVVRVFGWERLELLYQYVLVGLAFVALIVFQPELRRALIRVGDAPFHRTGGRSSQLISALVKSAGHLSRNRYGALVAIQRDVDLTGWAENGTIINAEVSANLLNSIFFPNSPLHDLGVIVRGDRVVAANCQFPSPDSDEIDAALGSRHLAAVGMSYESDALVLVVSEETGVISLADNGKLTRYLTLDDLAAELEKRLARRSSDAVPRETFRLGRLWRLTRRALVVVPLTLVIWYIVDQATAVDTNVGVELTISHPDRTYLVDILEPDANLVDPLAPYALAFTTRFRGPGRAIDQLRAETADKPLRLTWELPDAYARPGEHSVLPDGLRNVIESLPFVTRRGLTVEEVGLKERLHLSVDSLVALTVPVRVTSEGVPIEVLRADPAEVELRIRSRDRTQLPPGPQLAIRALLNPTDLSTLSPDEVRSFDRIPLEKQIGAARVARIATEYVSAAMRVVVGQHETVRNIVVHLYVSPDVALRYEVEKSDLNEWRIDVDVAGKEERIRAVGPADVQAFVHVTADMVPPPGQPTEAVLRLLNVTILVPDGVRIATDRTYTVRVNLIPRNGSPP